MSKSPVLVETLVDRFGHVLQGQHAEVLPGQWVRLFGSVEKVSYVKGELGTFGRTVSEEPYDRTFKLGDQAEYDSYNLSYYGKIVSIGQKTVTIVDGQEKRRLTFEEFSRRNHDFDLAETQRKNAEELQCI